MRILHFHKSLRLEHGGVVRAVLDLCPALATAGHEVVLASPDPHDVPAEWDGRTGRPRVAPCPGRLGPGGRLGRAARVTVDRLLAAAEILHLHGMWSPHNLQLAALARRRGIPYVVSVHGMLDDWSMAQRTAKKRLYLAVAGRRMLERAAAVHCTAEAELRQARRHFPRGRGVVAPLVVDLADYRDLPGPGAARDVVGGLGGDDPVLLFLSRLHYKKGVEHLVRAVGLLADRGRPVHAVVAGSGDDSYVRRLRRLVEELGLSDRVRFPGFVSGRTKVSLYQAADAFVLPTSQENFGFVLFEALAAETPVITTRGSDTWPELVASGGAVVVEQDAAAVADALEPLLDEPARAAAMGRSGRAWVMRHLSPEAVTGRYEVLYAEAAATRHAADRSAAGAP